MWVLGLEPGPLQEQQLLLTAADPSVSSVPPPHSPYLQQLISIEVLWSEALASS